MGNNTKASDDKDAAAKTEGGEKRVRVYALVVLAEDGERYGPGDSFLTTPARAKQLGGLVSQSKPGGDD